MPNPNVVSIINPAEIAQAKAVFIPKAQQGELDWIPEIGDANYLMNLVAPHYVKDKVLIEIPKVKDTFKADWEKLLLAKGTHKKAKLWEKHVAALRDSLAKLLGAHSMSPRLIEFALTESEKIEDIKQIDEFFAHLLTELEKEIKADRIRKTLLEFERGLKFQNEAICKGGEGVDVAERIGIFQSKMQAAKVKPALIDFALDFFNQSNLIYGYYFFQHPLKNALTEASFGFVVKGGPSFSTNITVESPDSLLISCEKTESAYAHQGGEVGHALPNATICKTTMSYRIKFSPNASATSENHKDIIIEDLQGQLEIIDPKLRRIYIDHHLAIALNKVRAQETLATNNNLVIDLYLNDLKDAKGEIQAQYKQLNADTLFLFMRSHVGFAEKLLAGEIQPFFARKTSEIIADLKLIKQVHHYHRPVVENTDKYLDILEKINTQNISAIKKSLQINRAETLQCLLSIQDVPFIQNLLKETAIKNNLDTSVATHFAKSDISIAQSLLQPTRWERFKFSVRSLFKRTGPDEELAYKRFKSPQLKEVVSTFPNLWHSLFKAPNKPFIGLFASKENKLIGQLNKKVAQYGTAKRDNNQVEADKLKDVGIPDLEQKLKQAIEDKPGFYRYKLEGAELRSLIDTKQPRTDSYHEAVFVVTKDPSLFHQASIVKAIDLKDQVQYLIDNKRISLEGLATKEGGTKWMQLLAAPEKGGLDNENFGLLISQKLELDYAAAEHGATNLLLVLTDLFADDPNHKFTFKWTRTLSQHKDKLALAQAAMINCLTEKKIAVTASSLVAKAKDPKYVEKFAVRNPNPNDYPPHKPEPARIALPEDLLLAEIFLTQPLANAYRETSFTKKGKGMHNLQAALLKNNTIFEKFLTPGVTDNRKSGLIATSIANKTEDFLQLCRQNSHFKKLIKSTPALFECLEQAFSHDNMGDLLQKNFELKTLSKNLLATNPSYLDGLSVISATLELFENEQFKDSLLEISPELLELFERLALNARFKTKIVANAKNGDFFLFKQVWAQIKHNPLFNARLPELIALLPNSQLNTWLDKNKTECLYLIDKLLAEPSFYNELIKKCDDDVIKLLCRKADVNQLILLAINCEQFGKVYFATLQSNIEKPGISIEEFFNNVDQIQLALLIAKYPELLRNIPQPLMQRYADKISYAVAYSQIAIDPGYQTMIKNIHGFSDADHRAINYSSEEIQIINELSAEKNQNDVAQFIFNLLQDSNSRALAIRLLQHPQIIQGFLSAQKPQGGYRALVEILSNLVKNKDDVSNKLINALLLKAIVDPKFLPDLHKNSTALTEFFTGHADPELIAKFLMARRPALAFWAQGLNRLAEQPRLLASCLPALKQMPNFGQWVISLPAGTRASLVDQQLITKAEITNYLVRGDFKGSDLINGLLTESTSSESLLIDVLYQERSARYYFMKHTFGLASEVIEILCHEIKKGEKRLVADLMSEPYLDHLLEHADIGDVEKLLKSLLNSNFEDETTRLINKLNNFAKQNVSFRGQFLRSEYLLSQCLRFGFEKQDQGLAMSLLVQSVKAQEIPEALLDVIDKRSTKLTDLFNQSSIDVNEYMEFFLALLTRKIADPRALKFVDWITSDDEQFLTTLFKAHPQLQQKVLTAIFALVRSSDDVQLVLKFKSLLQKFAGLKNKVLTPAIETLSADDLVDLCLLDYPAIALSDNPDDYLPGVFEGILQEAGLSERLFLLANEKKLIELMNHDDELGEKFLKLTNHNDTVGAALRERIVNSKLPSGANFPSYLILSLDQKFDLLSQLMTNHLAVYQSLLKVLCDLPVILTDNQPRFANFINYIITNKDAEDLLQLINAFPNDERNGHSIINHLYTILSQAGNLPAQDLSLQKAVIKHFGQLPNANMDLIDKMIHHLTFDQLQQLLLQPQLDALFIAFFRKNPATLQNLFKDNSDAFVNYFKHTKHTRELYVALNETLSKSEFATRVDQALADNFALAFPMITSANAKQLVEIYNLEGKVKKDQLTKIIFPSVTRPATTYLKRMLEELPAIDPDMAFNLDMVKALNDPEIRHAYYIHFKLNKTTPLKFVNSDQPVNSGHRSGYMYILRLLFIDKCTRDPSQERLPEKYNLYLQSLKYLVRLNSKGEFCFKDSQDIVPVSLAIGYFEALAFFFYAKDDKHSIRKLIETDRGFSQKLISTVIFNDPIQFSANEGSVPSHYIHAVLHAYCQQSNVIKLLTPQLINAFLDSVQFYQGKVIFKIEGKDPKDIPEVSEKYLQTLRACAVAKTSSETSIPAGPQSRIIFDLLLTAEADRAAQEKALDSIYVDIGGTFRFRGDDKELSASRKTLVFELVQQFITDQPSLNIFSLAAYLPEKDQKFRNYYVTSFIQLVMNSKNTENKDEQLANIILSISSLDPLRKEMHVALLSAVEQDASKGLQFKATGKILSAPLVSAYKLAMDQSGGDRGIVPVAMPSIQSNQAEEWMQAKLRAMQNLPKEVDDPEQDDPNQQQAQAAVYPGYVDGYPGFLSQRNGPSLRNPGSQRNGPSLREPDSQRRNVTPVNVHGDLDTDSRREISVQ